MVDQLVAGVEYSPITGVTDEDRVLVTRLVERRCGTEAETVLEMLLGPVRDAVGKGTLTDRRRVKGARIEGHEVHRMIELRRNGASINEITRETGRSRDAVMKALREVR